MRMTRYAMFILIVSALFQGPFVTSAEKKAKIRIVDTGQTRCYDNQTQINYPRKGSTFYGQDAQYETNPPAYKNNGDGTITDLVTGLMWSKAVDSRKVTLIEAKEIAKKMTLGGHADWRVPTIKELYSLIDFSGYTGFSRNMKGGYQRGRDQRQSNRQSQMGSFYNIPDNAVPFINTDYFDFKYGNIQAGERYIDAQWLSSTEYTSTTMNGMKTLFGVNFADGRIKGYGYQKVFGGKVVKKFYARYVRGSQYGQNSFVDNGDGTVTDKATGLMWMKNDSGRKMNWQDALEYAEKLDLAGHGDWRLPNAKELQYIVDYSRSPDATNSAAISPIFQTTPITNEAGQKDFPCFWTSTTHLDGPRPGSSACYIAFGRAIGKMWGKVMDVHGAGAQRSDPKTGYAGIGHGPQGDARRVLNFVRCVRGGKVKKVSQAPAIDKTKYPYNYQVSQSSTSQPSSYDRSPQKNNDQGGYQQGAVNFNNSSKNSRSNSFHPANTGDSGSSFHNQNLGTSNLGKRFVKRLDKDGDGKVSKSEFDGPSNHFPCLDKDNDGYLSENEAPPPPNRGVGQTKQQPSW